MTKPSGQLYQIKVKGGLDSQRAAWFEDVHIVTEANNTVTVLTGWVDQAALHGLLIRVRDLGLPLLSVNLIESRE